MPVVKDGKLYIYFVRADYKIFNDTFSAMYFLHLFNVTDNKLMWISEEIPIDFQVTGTPGAFPIYHDGKIILSNDSMYAYDFEDGSMLWKTYFGNSFTLISRITAGDGMVYGNNENRFFVGVDIETGEEKFRFDSGSTPSRVVYHNGNCYMAGLSRSYKNYIVEIDGKTGEILQEIDAEEVIGEEAEFNWTLTIDPETNLLYTCDYEHILCFDIL